jgi:hypothetical protein
MNGRADLVLGLAAAIGEGRPDRRLPAHQRIAKPEHIPAVDEVDGEAAARLVDGKGRGPQLGEPTELTALKRALVLSREELGADGISSDDIALIEVAWEIADSIVPSFG